MATPATYGMANMHKTLDMLEGHGADRTPYPEHFHTATATFDTLDISWKEYLPYSTAECGCGVQVPHVDGNGNITYFQEYRRVLTRAEALSLAQTVEAWVSQNRPHTVPRTRTIAPDGTVTYTHFGTGNYTANHQDGSARYHAAAYAHVTRERDYTGAPMQYTTTNWWSGRTQTMVTTPTAWVNRFYEGQKRE